MMMKSYALLLFCVAMWGSNFVFASILLQEFSPLLVSLLRLLFTTGFLLGYASLGRKLVKPKAGDWKLLLLLSVVAIPCNQISYFIGLVTVDATTASLVMSLTPIAAMLLGTIFLRESMKLRSYLGSIMAIIGVYLIVGAGGAVHWSGGIVFILVSMLSTAGAMVITRKLTEKMDAFLATVYSTAIGTALMVLIVSATSPAVVLSSHVWAWALLIGTGIMMQGVCGLIWNSQLKRVGVGKSAVLYNLQPFVAMLTGLLLLGTTVTMTQLKGTLFIVGGVLLATVEWRNRNQADARPGGMANARRERIDIKGGGAP